MVRAESPTPSDPVDPIEAKIRELQAYSYDDDADSSVNIRVEPGAIVNVTAQQDSLAPFIKKSKAVKIVAAVAGALVSLGLVAKAMWDAAH
ncbi:MAG: hypothetical protein WDO74_17900 [Pseudomonadota bacterium]